MFVTDGRSNYDTVCEELLALALKASEGAGGTLHALLFGQHYELTRDGVRQNGQKLDTMGSILVLRYLLTGGTSQLQHVWVPYRDLKDGAQFSAYIKSRIEDRLAAGFAGKKGLLKERLQAMNATPYEGEMRADLAMVLHPFPRVPVLCLFYDRDDEFEASFQFLFDASAGSYLDLESLAALLEYIHLKVTGEI